MCAKETYGDGVTCRSLQEPCAAAGAGVAGGVSGAGDQPSSTRLQASTVCIMTTILINTLMKTEVLISAVINKSSPSFSWITTSLPEPCSGRSQTLTRSSNTSRYFATLLFHDDIFNKIRNKTH